MVHAEHPKGGDELASPFLAHEEVEVGGPARAPDEAGADLVEHLEARRQPRFERVLGQEPLAEAVDRPNGRLVDLQERGPSARIRAVLLGCVPRAGAAHERRSSAAAASVKVTAAISRNGACPRRTSWAIRSTMAEVLPEPAPASTNNVASRSFETVKRASASAKRCGSGTEGSGGKGSSNSIDHTVPVGSGAAAAVVGVAGSKGAVVPVVAAGPRARTVRRAPRRRGRSAGRERAARPGHDPRHRAGRTRRTGSSCSCPDQPRQDGRGVSLGRSWRRGCRGLR